MIDSGSIAVTRTMRYAIRPASETCVHMVYLLHGYGQLARYFLRKVETVLPGSVCFVAPEGLHRFYLEGTSGRVGASWMTKEARETDIIENTQALDVLHESLQQQFQPEKVTVIGFSQGGATAARWTANGKLNPDCFVSWASVFPPDIDTQLTQAGKFNSRNVFVLGSDDPYFRGDDATDMCAFYKQQGYVIIRFPGGHDLDAAVIETLIQQL